MKTLLDLAKRMDYLSVEIPKALSNNISQTSELLQVGLTAHTPVDTSKALSNWVLTLEEPFDLDLDAYRLGSGGSTQNASIQEALTQGRQQLKLKKPGMPVFISNNADYIRKLNDGSSKQAPAGFIEREVMIAKRSSRRIGFRVR